MESHLGKIFKKYFLKDKQESFLTVRIVSVRGSNGLGGSLHAAWQCGKDGKALMLDTLATTTSSSLTRSTFSNYLEHLKEKQSQSL